MMFVTVGTGPHGFDRLVRGVDAIATSYDKRMRAQIGRGDYIPRHLDWFRFTDEDEIHDLYRTATVVIAHAGAGTLLTALSYGKSIVVLPRRGQHGEHNDDHQRELATALADRSGVFVVWDTDELRPAVDQARRQSNDSSDGDASLTRFLANYINDL